VCTKSQLDWLNLPHLLKLPPSVTAKSIASDTEVGHSRKEKWSPRDWVHHNCTVVNVSSLTLWLWYRHCWRRRPNCRKRMSLQITAFSVY